ncbi:MAG: Acylphosphatase [Phycisphaerae bacterium]|nr:Acylphosphatase [Phycisphaerae bacterium]
MKVSGRTLLAAACLGVFLLGGCTQRATPAPQPPAAAPVTPAAPAATPIVRRHAFVSGRVQGVGFRVFTMQQARILGVVGWVRNLDDGRVEAVMQGTPDAVGKLVEKVRVGPSPARVDKVELTDEPVGEEFTTFNTR